MRCFPMTDLLELHKTETLVATAEPNIHNQGIGLSIDLTGDENGLVGYRGKRHTGVVDVDKKAAPCRSMNSGNRSTITVPTTSCLIPMNSIFLSRAKRSMCRRYYAAEMVPFDPLVGEFRVHYAGFFDPGFGHAAGRRQGCAGRPGSPQP